MFRIALIAMGTVATALAGCASTPQQAEPTAKVQRYLNHAGEPVNSFSMFGHVNGWNALDGDRLVVWTGVNDAYLLSVDATCMNLQFANRIGITSTTGNRVQSGFDYVRFDDGFTNQRCRITEIRPVDYDSVREDLKANT